MFWLTRKQKTDSELLLKFESDISSEEYKLMNLKNGSLPYGMIILTTTLISTVSFYYKISTIFWIIGDLCSISILVYLSGKYKHIKIRQTELKIKVLREQQKRLIEKCKKDINFTKTKELIEKYEDEEEKQSYFKMIKQKRRNSFDFLTDRIMSPDPSKMNALICKYCGQHNGLIDPLNSEIDLFFCYSCKSKNERKINQECNSSKIKEE